MNCFGWLQCNHLIATPQNGNDSSSIECWDDSSDLRTPLEAESTQTQLQSHM